MTEKRLTNMTDLRAYLGGVSRSTVYKFEREDGFPERIKIGGRSVWDLNDVDKWIDKEAGK